LTKRVVYLAAVDPSRDAGVIRKIESTVSALQAAGWQAEAYFATQDGTRGMLQLARRLLKVNADVVILRSCGYYAPLQLPGLLRQRIKGRRIVIDVPSPIRNLIAEHWGQQAQRSSALLRIGLTLLAQPWCHWPAHRIIQYSIEHPWFLLGLKGKTLLQGNGVRVAQYQACARYEYSADPIVFIAVGKLAFWHGYDRMLMGLYEYEAERAASVVALPAVRFVVVGDGPHKRVLEEQVVALGLDATVTFAGYRQGHELSALYRGAHVAVSSLGLHRQKITVASPLKTREYVAMGFPVLLTYEDRDLSDAMRFVFRAPADDSAIPISTLVEWYQEACRAGLSAHEVRRCAEERLDYSGKISAYTDGLFGG
jgi:glycosyltransferase involved in cell wall biosynthesis